jgi:hypothetical protein
MSASEEVNQHILQCLHDIAERHFEAGSNLVISYNMGTYVNLHAPTKYLKSLRQDEFNLLEIDIDTWDLVLADFYLSEKWTLLHVQSYDKNNSKYALGRIHGSYILVAAHGQIEEVAEDIRQQIIKLKVRRDWNPRGNFLILLLQTDTLSDDDQKNLAAAIFTEFWKYWVANVVVLTRCSETRLQESDSERELLPVLDAYTWFPYQTPASCGETKKAIRYDRWVMNNKGNGHFLYNASLYPHKIPKRFNRCPLRVSAFEYPPVMMGMKTDKDGTIEYEEGIEVKLLHEMAKSTNMSVLYRPPPPDNGYWGEDMGNGSWTGLSGEIIRGYSDVALDNFWYKCHLINEMECLVPHFEDSARWFVPCAKPYPRWTSITRVFKAYLWLGFLAAYIIVALFMWIVAKINYKIHSSDTHNEAYANIMKCFLNFWAVILGESASDNPPQVLSIRSVFLMWVLYCWAVNTVYQTFLTTYLVDTGLQSQISSEEELLHSGIRYGVHKVVLFHIPHLASQRYPHRIDCVTFEECQDRAAIKGDLAFVFSALNMEYVIAERYMDGNGKPLICKFDEVISNQIISMPVPKGLPMMGEFNGVIQAVIEAGLLEQWLKDIKYKATLTSAKDFVLPPGEYTKLTLEHLQSPFYFLFLGYAFSAAALIAEKVFRWNATAYYK